MQCYIVTFQIDTEETINKVKELLKSYGYYCPIHNNCWAIKTEENAIQIRDKIQALLSINDRLFVIRSGTEAAWYNSYGEKHSKWLKENL